MGMILAKLVATIAVAVSNSGAFANAEQTAISLPPQAAAPTVVCNPAWGTIVLPICI